MGEGKPWGPRPDETRKSRQRFIQFLKLGPGRTFLKLSRKLGHPDSYANQLRRWGKAFDWHARADAFDEHEAEQSIAQRPLIREAALKIISESAGDAAQMITDLINGKLEPGDTTPIFDRHGEQVGQQPLVKPSTRLQAAIRIHESIGIIPPKRVEHTGRDGEEIRAAVSVAAGLEPEHLDALRALLLPEETDQKTKGNENE